MKEIKEKHFGERGLEEKVREKLIHAIEKHQKTLNSIDSSNSKRRMNINCLRKDRTVFDKVFKGIEVNIMKEERKIIKQIKKLKEKQDRLEKVEKDLIQLESCLGGEDRDKLAQKIEEIYKEHFVDYTGDEDDQEFLGELLPKSGTPDVVDRPNSEMSMDNKGKTLNNALTDMYVCIYI